MRFAYFSNEGSSFESPRVRLVVFGLPDVGATDGRHKVVHMRSNTLHQRLVRFVESFLRVASLQ